MSTDDPMNAIEEAAAAWLVERDRGLTPARAQEFHSWLREDPRHAAAFHALAETWALIGESAAVPDDEEASLAVPARTGKMAWLPLALSAAAALAVAYAGWWRTAPGTADHPAPLTLAASTVVGDLLNAHAMRR